METLRLGTFFWLQVVNDLVFASAYELTEFLCRGIEIDLILE